MPIDFSANIRARPIRLGLSRNSSMALEAALRATAARSSCGWAFDSACVIAWRESIMVLSPRLAPPRAESFCTACDSSSGKAVRSKLLLSSHLAAVSRPLANSVPKLEPEASAQACEAHFSIPCALSGAAGSATRTLCAHFCKVTPRSPSPSRLSSSLSSGAALSIAAAHRVKASLRRAASMLVKPSRTGNRPGPEATAPIRCPAASV